jgi:hypothetical protein
VLPRVREDSVHPRLRLGACVRPLSFTVRAGPGPSVPAQHPSPQNLPRWFVTVSLAGAIYTVVALGVLTLYSRSIGLLMLLPVGVFLVVAMVRAPWGQLAAADTARRRTPLGRGLRVAETVVLIYILFEAGRWLYGRL